MRRIGWGRTGWVLLVLTGLSLSGATPARGAAPASAMQAVAGSESGFVHALRSELEAIVRSAAANWRSSRWSVMAVSLDTGETLFADGATEALAPASNMKLLTSAAAIEQLGPDFRYQTFLLAAGPVSTGRLRGDLVLYGTGDPGISDRFRPRGRDVFEGFADSLLAAGIHVIEGDVVGDGSYFSGPFLGEGWNPNDLNDWFAAGSTALAYNENVFSLRVRGVGSAGAAPEILTLPADAGVPTQNTARVGSGTPLVIRRAHPSEPILVQGTIAGGGREVWRQMTVQDPAHFAASILRSVLEERGIEVLGGARAAHVPTESAVTGRRIWAPVLGSAPAPRVLARHISPPLRDYLAVVNKRSHNLLADQVLKTLGRIVEGEGSFEGGARALERFLAEAVGIDPTHVAVYDGSGLSRFNRVSAADLIGLLAYMARDGDWDSFWETLPEAGNPRELRRMARTAAAGNLRAKTGTIQNVSALSGMVHSSSGERIAFSIIANQVPSTSAAKGIEDRIGSRLADFARPYDPLAPGATVLAEADVPEPPVAGIGAGSQAAGQEEPGASRGDDVEAPPPAAEPEGRQHQVRPGESFAVIARLYDIPVDALVEANPQLSPRRLQIGSTVEIPAPRR